MNVGGWAGKTLRYLPYLIVALALQLPRKLMEDRFDSYLNEKIDSNTGGLMSFSYRAALALLNNPLWVLVLTTILIMIFAVKRQLNEENGTKENKEGKVEASLKVTIKQGVLTALIVLGIGGLFAIVPPPKGANRHGGQNVARSKDDPADRQNSTAVTGSPEHQNNSKIARTSRYKPPITRTVSGPRTKTAAIPSSANASPPLLPERTSSPATQSSPSTDSPKPCVPANGGNTYTNLSATGGLYGIITTATGDCWNRVEAHGAVAGILEAPHGEGLPADLQEISTRVSFTQKVLKTKNELGLQETLIQVTAKEDIESPAFAVFFAAPFREAFARPEDRAKIEIWNTPVNNSPGAPDDPKLRIFKIKQSQPMHKGDVFTFGVTNDPVSQPMVTRVCAVIQNRCV